jgi:hypothetical protein
VLVAGLVLLVALYLCACHARWLVARHFGQSWTLLDLWLIREAWDHLRCSGHALAWRVLVAVWFLLSVLLIVWGIL